MEGYGEQTKLMLLALEYIHCDQSSVGRLKLCNNDSIIHKNQVGNKNAITKAGRSDEGFPSLCYEFVLLP